MRLFVGEPVWTPYNRKEAGVDEMVQRKSYVASFIEGSKPTAAVMGGAGAGGSA